MQHTRVADQLTIHLDRDLNLFTARYVERLAESASRVIVDLKHARLADTEAVIHLSRLQKQGTSIALRNPPSIFLEVLRVLDLTDAFTIVDEADGDPSGAAPSDPSLEETQTWAEAENLRERMDLGEIDDVVR